MIYEAIHYISRSRGVKKGGRGRCWTHKKCAHHTTNARRTPPAPPIRHLSNQPRPRIDKRPTSPRRIFKEIVITAKLSFSFAPLQFSFLAHAVTPSVLCVFSEALQAHNNKNHKKTSNLYMRIGAKTKLRPTAQLFFFWLWIDRKGFELICGDSVYVLL